MKITKTKETLEKLRIQNKGIFEYPENINSKTRFTAFCKKHSKHFTTWLSSHMKTNFGCEICKEEFREKLRLQKELNFISTSKSINGLRFDYSRVHYKSAREIVTLICEHHGEFQTCPNNHIGRKEGCPRCSAAKLGKTKAHKAADCFEAKARAVHGGIYSYSDVVYTTSRKPVTIICKNHGVFDITPDNHLRGKGCPSCSEYGYDPNKVASLYVLRFENYTKVGITNNKPSVRAIQINQSSGLKFEVVRDVKSQGNKIRDLENFLLTKLRDEYNNPIEKYDGYKETFLNVDHVLLDTWIEEGSSLIFN